MSWKSRRKFILQRSCKNKRAYTVTQARAAAARISTPEETVAPYRCPFADDHRDPSKRWHVGHAPSLDSLQSLARLIRERRGYPLEK